MCFVDVAAHWSMSTAKHPLRPQSAGVRPQSAPLPPAPDWPQKQTWPAPAPPSAPPSTNEIGELTGHVGAISVRATIPTRARGKWLDVKDCCGDSAIPRVSLWLKVYPSFVAESTWLLIVMIDKVIGHLNFAVARIVNRL